MIWCDLSAGRAHALVCWKMSSGPCTQFSVPSDWRWVFAVIVSSPAQGRFGIQVRLSPGARAIMPGVDCHKKWLECGRNVCSLRLNPTQTFKALCKAFPWTILRHGLRRGIAIHERRTGSWVAFGLAYTQDSPAQLQLRKALREYNTQCCELRQCERDALEVCLRP